MDKFLIKKNNNNIAALRQTLNCNTKLKTLHNTGAGMELFNLIVR